MKPCVRVLAEKITSLLFIQLIRVAIHSKLRSDLDFEKYWNLLRERNQ